MKSKAILALALAVPAFGQFGGATFCTNCATSLGQSSEISNQVAQLAKDAAILQNTLSMYNQMVNAGKLLSNMQWRDATMDLTNMAGIIQTSQGLAMSAVNIDQQFNRTFPGLIPPMSMQPGGFYGMYNQWSNATMQSLQGAIRGTSMNYQTLMNQSLYSQYLQTASTSALGQMQAIQAGNLIGLATVQSVNNLNSMMTADMTARQAVAAYQIQNDMTSRALDQKLFGNPMPVTRTGYAIPNAF